MRLRPLLVAVTIVAAAACGTDDARPDDAVWAPVWQAQRDSVPAAEVFLDQGQVLCSDLVGQLHAGREELLPTPVEELDAAVRDWVSHAESIAFDCPTNDPDRLRDRLHGLDVLAAEVEAGLAADQTP